MEAVVMTIKEVEYMLGMARANIRYYEQEGLLHPKRQKNGYRDYSEQDVLYLKKVKLLRELGVPLADIKKLQSGELLLPEEMWQRITELEQQQKEQERTKCICADIWEDQVSYQQLNADKYLYDAFRETDAGGLSEGPGTEQYLAQDHPAKILPFRRLLARATDLFLLLEAIVCIISLLHENYYFYLYSPGAMAVLQLASILIEPVLLHFTGTTVGKWIFGFQLTDMDGKRLTYRAALWRTIKVYFLGMGFNIPFLNLYRLYKSYQTVDEGWKAPWDDEVEYTQRQHVHFQPLSRFRNSSWRYAFLAMVLAASYVVTHGFILYAMAPPNRGNITLEEFVENYNQAARYFGYTEYFYQLKPDGSFYTPQESSQQKADEMNISGTVILDMVGDYEMPEFSYSFDGKYLKQAAMHIDLKNYPQATYFIYPNKPMTFAALAFAGAQDGIGLWKNERGKIAEKLMGVGLSEGFSYRLGGMDIICNVSGMGFTPVDIAPNYLMAWTEKNRLQMDFTIGADE